MSEFAKTKQPRAIVHLGKTEERVKHLEDMLTEFSAKMGLRDNETDLLRAYCKCADGFKPSVKYMENETGMIKRTILRIRNELTRRNIIVETDKHILVRWNDYFAVCLADEKLMTRNGSITQKRNIKLGEVVDKAIEYISDSQVLDYYMDITSLISLLGRLTEDEADKFMKRLKKLLKDPKVEDEDWYVHKYTYESEHMVKPEKKLYTVIDMGEPLPF